MVPAGTLKYTLFGYPLGFSLSPQIHQAFAKQFGLKFEYDLTAVAPENFQNAWQTFFANGGSGANITAPYKEIVYSQLQNLTPNAAVARAVNTVVMQSDDTLLGENTDGVGLIKDFARKNINVTNQEILILGAGGAVRGIVPALLALHPKRITIANRDMQKAELLINDFNALGDLELKSYSKLHAIYADIIINATSSLDPDYCAMLTHGLVGMTCYDLNYAATSNFIQTAKANGAQRFFNGVGMLLEQAAAAFTLWQRVDPDVSLIEL